MAVYRKKLLDKDGNTIIPAVGDIYGTVYTATLSSATAGVRADYEFTPDTPVENNKVYAVIFPDPTVNNATIILGDGVVSGSILVPPVSATDSPNYELLTTDMINNTEPLLLMYSGVQWVCLNQKKKVATSDLENGAVTQDKIAGGWKLIGEVNGTNITNLPLYLDKIYKAGTFKVIAGGQCNVEGWVDLRAYYGSAVGNATLIKTSYAQVSFSGTVVYGSGSDANDGFYIAAGDGKANLAFSTEATSSNSGGNWRTWNFQFGCGTWGRIGTTRESNSYNKTAFSLVSANPMFDAHIEVWWHE